MFSNQIKIAWRKIIRQKGFTTLNLLGLSVGLAATLLMVAYVYHQYSFDRFHQHVDHIFKTTAQYKHGERTFNSGSFSAAFGRLMQDQIPEIDQFVRLRTENEAIFSTADGRRKHSEDGLYFADSNFLEVFTFDLLEGNAESVLQNPFSLLLTPEMAQKYFGVSNPIGKTLNYLPVSGGYQDGPLTENFTFTVSGIIAPAPTNSNIQYDFVASFNSLQRIIPKAFEKQIAQLGAFQTYFLLSDPLSVETVQTEIEDAINTERERETSIALNTLPQTYFDDGVQKKLSLFIGIALLVLLLAIVNYASLTTARSTQRAKEVGVRKTLGAGRAQLIAQFFGESSLMVLLSFVCAMGLSWLGLPLLNKMAEATVTFQLFSEPMLISAIVCIFLLSVFLAGSYPALALSRFLPAKVLRGGKGENLSGERTRKVLLVFQFTISASLIICSLVMQAQMRYLGQRDLGFDQDQLLVIPFETNQEGQYGAFKDSYLQESGVINGGVSTAVPFKPEGTNIFFVETPKGDPISLFFINVDRDFLPTLDVNWSAGELASATAFGKGQKALINERAYQDLGLAQAVGSHILKDSRNEESTGYEVTGVIDDYTFFSYQNEVGPQVLFEMSEEESRNLTESAYLTLRLQPGIDIQSKMARFKDIYEGFQPAKPFDFFFIDDAYNNLFRKETQTASLFNLFTVLAIFIACLGLLGLSAYVAERRTKEIGIRKVFGASVSQIIGLLSIDFLYLVAIALLIAIPLAWYFMQLWLEDFSFRIELGLWHFVLAAILALGIAFLTVSFQSLRAAMVNPIKSLRNE